MGQHQPFKVLQTQIDQQPAFAKPTEPHEPPLAAVSHLTTPILFWGSVGVAIHSATCEQCVCGTNVIKSSNGVIESYTLELSNPKCFSAK